MQGRRGVGLVLGALLLLCACAGTQREEQHFDWAGEYVYAQSAERLVPEVKGFFARKQVGLKSARGKAGYYFVSEWQESHPGNAWRYYVEVSPLGPESASVRIFRHARLTGGKGSTRNGTREAFRMGTRADTDERKASAVRPRFSRDPALEWELLQRLAPRAAAARKAQEARARR